MTDHAPPETTTRARVAGVTIPLFSIRSARSWGIGEIGDLPAFGALLASAGVSLLQLLPLGEISGGDTSPYSALSAFGIDPMYVSIADVPDLPADRIGGVLGAEGAAALAAARASRTVDYGAVRALKRRALAAAFASFLEREHGTGSERARAFVAFVTEHAAWLEDFALYRALKDAHEGAPWSAWYAPIRRRLPEPLERARGDLAEAMLHHAYLQWLAHQQWEAARAELRRGGVAIMGDLPFMVGRDSADVWANPDDFKADASVGVPPDEFNDEGQDWDLPPYDWDKMAADGHAWLRSRARYAASLYDLFRIDHVVGFYRTYSRPSRARLDARGKLVAGRFEPAAEAAQLAHGEAVIRAMIEAAGEGGARLVAEDLGTVPEFVRPSLARLGVPGYKVLIWEKDGAKFRDPAAYPPVSVACFGTHDTDPVKAWWESRAPAERAALHELPALAKREKPLDEAFTPEVHRALLELIAGSASEIVLLLVQDVFGVADRINTPATVGAHNWSYRLPGTVEEIARDPSASAALATLREVLRASRREGPPERAATGR